VNAGRIMWVLVLFVLIMHMMACLWYVRERKGAYPYDSVLNALCRAPRC
jgi:hypothetical protein